MKHILMQTIVVCMDICLKMSIQKIAGWCPIEQQTNKAHVNKIIIQLFIAMLTNDVRKPKLSKVIILRGTKCAHIN